jgi:hypothetical protein
VLLRTLLHAVSYRGALLSTLLHVISYRVSTTEELFGRKSSGSCLENWGYGRGDPSRWPRGTLYPQKLAITSPTSGGRSVGIVRSRTQTIEFFFFGGQQLRCAAASCEWRTVELLDGLQNSVEKGQGDEAGQWTRARRELGTARSKIKPQAGRMLRWIAMEEKVKFWDWGKPRIHRNISLIIKIYYHLLHWLRFLVIFLSPFR